MESAKQERRMQHFTGEQRSIVRPIVSCVAGMLGLVVVAAAPWLLLTSDAVRVASEQPAFQAARTFPSVAESTRMFSERLPYSKTGRQAGAPEVDIRLATSPR